MSSFRRKNGKFIKKAVYERNIKAHKVDKDNEPDTPLSADHSYTVNEANYSPDTDNKIIPSGVGQLIDLDTVHREKICVCSQIEISLSNSSYWRLPISFLFILY